MGAEMCGAAQHGEGQGGRGWGGVRAEAGAVRAAGEGPGTAGRITLAALPWPKCKQALMGPASADPFSPASHDIPIILEGD